MVSAVGGCTVLMSSLLAISQSNTKRVLAYSTIGNLGLIAACAGVGTPEQGMWHSMARCDYTGHRRDCDASGYNAQCVETTLSPLTSGEISISFGCYGCRASSDVDDSLMMMGIPVTLMDEVVRGLRELGRRAIPQSRDKVYLPPF